MVCLSGVIILKGLNTWLKVKDGGGICIYSMFKEEVDTLKTTGCWAVRHIMIDEIELKNVIVFNFNSNTITDFVLEQFNIKTVLQLILQKT